MIYDFNIISKDILEIKSQEEFSQYLESNFIEIEEYLLNISSNEIDKIKFDIEDMLYDMIDYKLIQDKNNKTINAFLILLAEKFLQTSLIGSITIINNYIPTSATKLRLEAAKLYLKVNDISKDYKNKASKILELLDSSAIIDEYNTNAIKSFLFFVQSALQQFNRVKNKSLAEEFIKTLLQEKESFNFLQDETLVELFKKIPISNIHDSLELISNQLENSIVSKGICDPENKQVKKEAGSYAETLKQLTNPNFETIRKISYQYIQSIGDPIELYNRLQRGEVIIDDQKLLYKYLVSYGSKHKQKLESAYDLIIDKLENRKFDIVDWGCGQATASMVLLSYAKKKNITLDIENITLIEPSKLALSRGLLHIDILKQKEYNIKAINSDLDCLDENEIIKSKNKTLHIFSNILDIESFSLNNDFFKKASSHLENDSIFVCVSPNRNDKLNNRLDLFYQYFDANFDTELISSRDTDIGNSTRYEKIFEVMATKDLLVEETRSKIELVKDTYTFNALTELKNYENYIVPIINMKILEDSINIDPEYAIFKIRKVAEVITSKIYSQYESNSSTISFNDKIRYLSYEKNLFDKTISNYVHTLRTIGNRGVHDHTINIQRLKLDAHLMVIALISFIQELSSKKLI